MRCTWPDGYELIDGFIEYYKDELSLADIVITKTGEMRCKTNVRFDINDLRDLSMILSKDAAERRCLAPTAGALRY